MPSSHRRWRPPALFLPLIALVVLALTSLAAASPEGPKPQLSHSLFDNLPSKITYFEDSPVVLYHDQIARDVSLAE
ncbi:vacuolar protein sorting/targeting protein PEP1 [Rhodotorula toruloides]